MPLGVRSSGALHLRAAQRPISLRALLWPTGFLETCHATVSPESGSWLKLRSNEGQRPWTPGTEEWFVHKMAKPCANAHLGRLPVMSELRQRQWGRPLCGRRGSAPGQKQILFFRFNVVSFRWFFIFITVRK